MENQFDRVVAVAVVGLCCTVYHHSPKLQNAGRNARILNAFKYIYFSTFYYEGGKEGWADLS